MKDLNYYPLISVVVPVYNVENYIHECVDSILKQDYQNIEIILVNDRSSDSSGIICDEYARKYEYIYTIHNDINLGLGLTRNVGIEHAKGLYITFIDSDDFVSENHISTLYNSLKKAEADVCYGGFTSFNGVSYTEHTNVLKGKIVKQPRILEEIVPSMCGRTRLNEAVQMSSCMAIYSKSVIENNKIRFLSEREFISEDLLFNIDFLKSIKTAVFSDDVGYFYRYNPQSLSHSYRSDRLDKQIVLAKKISDITNDLGIYKQSRIQIANTLLAWSRYCIQMEQNRWRELGFSESLKRINTICCNPDIIKYLTLYKKGNDRLASEMLNYMIKNKWIFILWCVMAVKNIRSL